MIDFVIFIGWAYGLIISAAGFKAALFHRGPGPVELVSMLWSGEITRRKL